MTSTKYNSLFLEKMSYRALYYLLINRIFLLGESATKSSCQTYHLISTDGLILCITSNNNQPLKFLFNESYCSANLDLIE